MSAVEPAAASPRRSRTPATPLAVAALLALALGCALAQPVRDRPVVSPVDAPASEARTAGAPLPGTAPLGLVPSVAPGAASAASPAGGVRAAASAAEALSPAVWATLAASLLLGGGLATIARRSVRRPSGALPSGDPTGPLPADDGAAATLGLLADRAQEVRAPVKELRATLATLHEAPLTTVWRARLQDADALAARLEATLDPLLDLARLESGRSATAPVEVDLRTWLDDIEAAARSLHRGDGTTPRVRVAPGLPGRIAVDPTRLRRILLELLAEAAPPHGGGRTVLEVRRPDAAGAAPALCWWIGPDDGAGAGCDGRCAADRPLGGAARDAPRSGAAPDAPRSGAAPAAPRSGAGPEAPRSGAEPARRRDGPVSDEPRSGPVPGGPRDRSASELPWHGPVPDARRQIVRRLARWIGGEVRDGGAPGSRHSVCLRLPLAPPPAPAAVHSVWPDDTASPDRPDARAAAVAGGAARAGSTERRAPALHVLAAEDEAFDREHLAAVLARLGHVVAFADDGEAAVRLACSRAFDVVLMDLRLPVLDGWAAARAIRACPDPLRSTVPIVALTADTTADARERCADAGMNGLLHKPVGPAELATALRRLFGGTAATSAPAVPGAVATAPEEALVDDAALQRALREGAPERYRRLASDFVDAVPRSAASMREALRDAGAQALQREARAVHDGAVDLGLAAVAAAAAALDDAAERLPAQEIARRVDRLEALAASTRSALQRQFGDAPDGLGHGAGAVPGGDLPDSASADGALPDGVWPDSAVGDGGGKAANGPAAPPP